MTDTNLNDISGLTKFVESVPIVTYSSPGKKEAYEWIKDVLNRFSFRMLKKREREIVRAYIQKVMGYSISQVSRLIAKYLNENLKIIVYKSHVFSTCYSPVDIGLLCQMDNIHQRLNGNATKHILWREYYTFKNKKYEKLSAISVAHIYRLRASRSYQTNSLNFTKTQAVK